MQPLWEKCLTHLQQEFPDDFNTWIRPLQPVFPQPKELLLLAPNRFVASWVEQKFLFRIRELLVNDCGCEDFTVKLGVGTWASSPSVDSDSKNKGQKGRIRPKEERRLPNYIRTEFIFDNFVKGSSNELALAAAQQVAENPGKSYNPLYIYGGVGLGKTHLMHAIGNLVIENNASSNVLYLHSERFVTDMVKAIQNNTIDKFKQFYRSVDVLLIDDIQFFARKERSQDEFFHTFNSLLEGQHQVVLSCDRYPKEISGLEERLKSRFGWGLTVAIEPPELETRVAILMSKASENQNVVLPEEIAFFIAKRIRSNVRELEGALRRVIANSHFTGKPITLDFTRETLKDLLMLQDKLITIDNIQKTVAEYYKIKVADLLSKRRNRSITLPRHMAMCLSKELTNRSLPEIGDAFGGRDHTTVIHACRKIKNFLKMHSAEADDYKNLLRTLSS